MGKFFKSNTSVFSQNDDYLERPRLYNLLENAMDYPLVVVCAGSGYGKTRAVSSFVQGYSAHIIWMQISERDNIATRFWENYSGVISSAWPEAGARLLEVGFPESDAAFARFNAVVNESIKDLKKLIIVFDDFHLLCNPVVLRLLERVESILSSITTVILITRTMPEFNLIGMMMRERVFTIQEDTLCFTKEETIQYFNLIKLQVSDNDIRDICDDTQGWAFAINLIGRSLTKKHKYERYALEAMKKNIFKLIEAETQETVSEQLTRFLLRISLIDHFTASLIKLLANSDLLIKEMELINAYIRYDFIQDAYMIHHLFLDYLRQKQALLSDNDKRETYTIAGKWCEANGYYIDSFFYYEKSGDYDAITRKIASMNVQMPPDMAHHALEIFDNAPQTVRFNNTMFPGTHIKLRINTGKFDEDTIALIHAYAESYHAQPESLDKYFTLSEIYGNWALLLMFMCTKTDAYDFDTCFEKMKEYYNKNPYKPIGEFTIVPVIAWASLVGTNRTGAMEEYINAVSRSIPAISILGKGFFAGFDDLARGELRFFRGEFDSAEQYLKQSIDKARAHEQYVTQNRALAYMIQIAFFRGDLTAATATLKEIEALLNDKDNSIRYTMYDIARGFYYLTLEQPEQIPEWLKEDFSPFSHPVYIENYANRVKALYHYKTHQYSELLAFIENTMERQTVLYGKIELKVLRALSLYRLKRRGKAFVAFTEAYHLAESNRLDVLFTRHGKDMRTLSAAVLKNNECLIDDTPCVPKQWLEDINRKAVAFAKQKNKMIAECASRRRVF